MGIRAYKDIVTGTHPKKLELHAMVLEARIGLGMTYREISNEFGLGMNTINNIINKYKPKNTGRDLVLIIKSNE